MATTPQSCLELAPTRQTIRLKGVAINVVELQQATGINHGYLSRVLNGRRRNVSLHYAARIAEGLGMSLDAFHAALDTRTQTIRKREQRAKTA